MGERTVLAEMAIKRLEWKERREKKLLKAVKCPPDLGRRVVYVSSVSY